VTTEGRTRRARAQGSNFERATTGMDSLDPRLARWADNWIFDQVWSEDESASFEDRMLVAIVALAATGRSTQLSGYLYGAVQDGMDPRRIHEALMLLPVYVGFPLALDALSTWQRVVTAEREAGRQIDVPTRSLPPRR
jgi:4-carboxymuconolactone decarboxylase